MKKFLIFCWLYYTDSMFRLYHDLYSRQAMLDRLKREQEEYLRYTMNPPYQPNKQEL
jgi:hypothetical protein